MRQRIFTGAVCALLLAAAGATPAQSDIRTVQLRVTSEGLDLTTEAGAAAFLERLSRGATAACGNYPDASPMVRGARHRFDHCRAQALADVVAQSGSPVLKRQFAATREAQILRVAER